LKHVSQMVARTLMLAQLSASSAASQQTNRYVREATKCYIYGLPMSSVAMSRAALEQSLKDRLGKQGDGDRDTTFGELVTAAQKWRILDSTDARAAKDLADKCNLLLHEKPMERDKAFEVLVAIRSLIQKIFSSNPGY
jgi:hypothetical protein